MSYLIDTNILIYYLGNQIDDEPVRSILIESFNISIITKIEFLGWRGFLADGNALERAKTFISYANVLGLSEAIANQTIQLRQQHKIKTPDAIIAATALVHNLMIVTNNTSDFRGLGVATLEIELK